MTELERHLLSAFEHLENSYATRERDLFAALQSMQLTLSSRFDSQADALSQRLNDTTRRLEMMTKAYAELLEHVDALSSLLSELQTLLAS